MNESISSLFLALIVEGIYKLSETIGKAPPLTNTQLVKFFDYFLSRLSVSRPRGVFALLQVLNKLNDNKVIHFRARISLSDFSHIFVGSLCYRLSIIRMG